MTNLKILSNSKVFLLLAVLGLVVFVNSLANNFLVDDHAFFTGQKVTVARLFYDFVPDVHNMMTAAAEDDTDTKIHYYRPLAHFLPMISYMIFGDNVVGHHALNLLLWVLAAWMVFLLIEAIFKDRILALATAVIYMVHPINGVLVNYITADVFSLGVICMCASLLFLLRSSVIASPEGAKQSKKISSVASLPRNDAFFSILFFILALLCHETSMGLPFYATAILIFARKQSWVEAVKKAQGLWITLIVFFLLRMKFASLADGIFGRVDQYHMNIFEYLATISKLMFWYISKLFWPVGVIMIKAQPTLRGGDAALWLVALAILVGGFVWLVRRKPVAAPALAGLWWFALGFVPFCFATLFRPSLGMMIEPHWFVFPVIGFFLWLVYTIRSLCKPEIFEPAIIALTFCLSGVSFYMNTLWDGDLTYCHYWVSQSPGFASPSYYLAMAYEKEKDFEEARKWYTKVLDSGQYMPNIIYTAFGYLDFMENRLDEAKSDLNKALAIAPNMSQAVADMGIVYFMEKDYKTARQYFQQAISLQPADLLSRLNLGKVNIELGRTDEALEAFEGALAIAPESKSAIQELVLMGMNAQKKGDMDTARRVYGILMRFAPNGPPPG
jgi:tetratricopeptide (TPR) repeat protein